MAKAAKSIAILGAGGSMGTWFSKYFIALKYSVTGFDSENAIKVKGVIGANSLVGAILTADYVLLCTPARKTPEIIRLIDQKLHLVPLPRRALGVSVLVQYHQDHLEGGKIRTLPHQVQLTLIVSL